MSKSDERMFKQIVLGVIAFAVIAFVLWLVGSAIKFLTNNLFVYGILLGLALGIGGTIVTRKLHKWWGNR